MIIVFGSINMDMVVNIPRMPVNGETLLCPAFEMSPGGKGANQALAALRSNTKVALVGRAGDDGMGLRIVTGLRREGVMTSGVGQSALATGHAFIMREPSGGNRIVVAGGANTEATADQIPDDILKQGNVLLLQMETPAEENWILLRRARARGAMTILNLAPVLALPPDILPCVDVLVMNHLEARQAAAMLGLEDHADVLKLAEAFSRLGPLTCVITLEAKGAVAWTKDGKPVFAPALKIDPVVDTTGAGDAFCGTLAAALHNLIPLGEAMKRATIAGSLACMKKGAHESFPYLGDIEDHLAAMK